ncbi:MAG: GPW/gp25 family protein [Oscillospiraceae bacterium]|nr:GPW/gp25 family protein [Oscillospiraceae bacterium]MCH5207532.1 GPW/gp25 family protein [Oscillospiraceae bacterium]
MSYTVRSTDSFSSQFQQTDTVKSVLQNIALLLNTKKGTVPMYREFGLAMNFVDKPIDVAETIAFSEITAAVEEFEPRAKVKNVTFEKDANGRMATVVEVEIL